MNKKFLVTALAIVVLAWPRTAAAQAAQCSTFGGRSTVVQANALGILPVVLSDTGSLDSAGGEKQASLLDTSVLGLLSGQDLHATSIAGGNTSQSEASITNLILNVAGNTISADLVMARANAYCGSLVSTVQGITEIDGLAINGQRIAVTGLPNQIISLPGGGAMTLNEQTGSVQGQNGSITVNALHVSVPGVMDAAIASPFAGIGGVIFAGIGGIIPDAGTTCPPVCGPPPPPTNCDFITGGGWIITPYGKGTFGVGGGLKNGQLWGHLEYHDHGSGLNVHGTGVTAYGIIPGTNIREIQGTAEINGQGGYTYIVDVADNGEPGRNDVFQITLSNGYGAGSTLMGDLGGGNIQLHTKCCGS
jgi:hypothetical protein